MGNHGGNDRGDNDDRTNIEPWLQTLVAQFEDHWKRAVDGQLPPDLEAVLAELDEPRRSTARTSLGEIERRYRQVRDGAEGTAPQSVGINPTVVVSNMSTGPDKGQSLEPDGDHEIEQTVELSDTAAISDGLARTMDPARQQPRADQHDSGYEKTQPLGSAKIEVTTGFEPADPMGRPLAEIPGYQVIGELGRGGMGVVYQARQIGLNRTVALKMILAGGHASPEQIARFQAEAEAVAQLQHPNIVQVYDVGEHQDLPFFSLEYVDGIPLDDEIDGQPLMPDRSAELVELIARAMQHAHEHGIVHRDLKPANVLLTMDGQPKVTDFGLVKRLEGESSQTRTGTIMGTPSYMAPEQGRGEKNIGPLADVYAMGGILYCCLTGRAPFVGATPMETLLQALNDEPLPPTRLQPKTPADLSTICLKCLQKDPEKRYASAVDLAEDLQRFRNGEPIAARPISNREKAWRWCKRNPKLATATGVASLALLALAIGGPTAAVIVYQQKQDVEVQKTAALAAKLRAQENESIAFEAQRKAQQQEQEAERQREVAVQQAEIATDSLRQLVYEATSALQNQPGMQPLREKILRIAVEGLDKATEANRDSPNPSIITASAFRKLGELYLNLGESEKSTNSFERSLEIALKLHANGKLSQPDKVFGDLYEALGTAALKRGEGREAESLLLKMLDHREKSRQGLTSELALHQELAHLYSLLSRAARLSGDAEKASNYELEGFRYRKEWHRAEPYNVDARRQYVGAVSTASTRYTYGGDIEVGLQCARDAYDMMRDLADQTQRLDDRANAGVRASWLGYVCLLDKKPSEAKEYYTIAIDRIDDVIQRDPNRGDYQEELADAYYGLGNAQNFLNARNEAVVSYRTSNEWREKLIEKDPNNSLYNRKYVLSLVRSGRIDEAQQLAAKLRESHGSDVGVAIHLACAECLMGDYLQTTHGLDGEYAEPIEAHYQRAIGLVESVIQGGLREFFLFRNDPDLSPLHDRKDYRAMLAAAESSSSPGQGDGQDN